MLNPQTTLEREAMLKRIRELEAEIAQHERNLREREARLPTEEQLRLSLRRAPGPNILKLLGNPPGYQQLLYVYNLKVSYIRQQFAVIV